MKENKISDYTEYKTAWATGEAGWPVPHDVEFNQLCRFCNTDLVQVFNPSKISDFMGETEWDISGLKVIMCPFCGWWQLRKTYHHDHESSYGRLHYLSSASLRVFSLEGREVPIRVLRDYLVKNPEKISNIDPTKMEHLVGDVLSDFFQCEVQHVGRSHDGGVDLLLVRSDSLMPIQVKRRANKEKSESVKVIREMFGVMFRDEYKKAAVVTTSRKFSRDALKEVNQVLKDRKCEEFNLWDFNEFSHMINVTSGNKKPSWVNVLASDKADIIMKDDSFVFLGV